MNINKFITMKNFRIIFIISMIILIGLFFIDLYINNVNSYQFHLFYAHDLRNYMGDFAGNYIYVSNNNPYRYMLPIDFPQDHAYPPIAYLIFRFLYKLAQNSDTLIVQYNMLMIVHFTMFIWAFFLLLTTYCGAKFDTVQKNLLMFCLIFSGIFISSWERGNIMFLASALITFFIFNYKSENKIIKELSLIFLALASALKLTPILLVLLLMYNKRWIDTTKLILYTAIFFFIPFLCFEGGFKCFGIMLHNMTLNAEYWQWVRIPEFACLVKFIPVKLATTIYTTYAFILGIIALLTNFAQKTDWKKIGQIVLVMFYMCSSSFMYGMLNIFPILILFFNQNECKKNDWIYLIIFIIMFNPFQIADLTGHVINFSLVLYSGLFMLTLLTVESVNNAVVLLKQNKIKQNYTAK